jgi:CRISPR-associated protein Csb2
VHRDSSERRRVPKQGTLDDLGSVYESFVNSVEGKRGYCPRRKPTVFDTVSYLPATSLPPRPYVAFTLDSVMEQARRPSFRQVDTVLVAAMLRHQACEAAKHDSHEFPTGSELYVAGHVRERHDTPQRFSYLPLPSIGHEHADGMIRRVLIAEPYGSDGEHARWAADRLRNANLVDEDRQPKAVLVRPEPGDYVLQSYVRQSKRWSSVTPVILPGLDDGKLHKRDAVFLKAVKQARLPADLIESFTFRSAPFWPGSQHPHEYRRPAYLKGYPAWHVHLQLREAIAGPLAIGAGRHCGLGLFAPERVQDSHDK